MRECSGEGVGACPSGELMGGHTAGPGRPGRGCGEQACVQPPQGGWGYELVGLG